MNDHYFTQQPNAASRPKTWKTELRGHVFQFTSDEGVFSKQGIDFGSKLLIEAFEAPLLEGKLLDVGCGYGPIGLALAASHPAREVEMVDINERAVKLSCRNAEQNHIDNVSVFQSNLFAEVQKSDFASIVTNPPIRAGKSVVYQLFDEAFRHLKAGGEFWVVIRKQQGAASALKKLSEGFAGTKVILKKKGYVVIKCEKSI